MTGELQAPATLPPEKTRYPLNGGLGGPKIRSRHLWRRKKSIALTRIRNPDRPACSTVTIVTTLPLLQQWTFMFHKMWRTSQLLVSHEGLCSMESEVSCGSMWYTYQWALRHYNSGFLKLMEGKCTSWFKLDQCLTVSGLIQDADCHPFHHEHDHLWVGYTAHICIYTITIHEVSIPFHSPQLDRTVSGTRCKGTYRTFLLFHCTRMKDYRSYIATVSSQGQSECAVGHWPHLTQPTPITEPEAKGLNFCELRYYKVILSTTDVMQ